MKKTCCTKLTRMVNVEICECGVFYADGVEYAPKTDAARGAFFLRDPFDEYESISESAARRLIEEVLRGEHD